MRWSSMVKVGLSGTSLALAVGCSQPAIQEEPEAEVVATAQADDDPSAAAAAEEARRLVDRDRRLRLAELEEQERQRASSPGETPWFLRPAGEVTPASTQRASGEGDQPIQNNPPKDPVVAQPKQPPKPVAQPAQPINNKKPWGWQRAACGRG